MLAQILVLTGIAINAVGTLNYVIGTLQGKIKPNRVTFFIWSIAPFVIYLSQTHQGVGVQALMTLSTSIFPLSVFVASFVNKKAYWELIPRDVVCGVLSLAGLFMWYVTKVGNLAIFFSLLSEVLATFPAIAKSYRYPETERAWPWLTAVTGGVLTLVTITDWDFAHAAYPVLYTIEMSLLYIFIKFKFGQRQAVPTNVIKRRTNQ